jgi:hypothetical protein
MGLGVEGIVDCGMGGEETLSGGPGLEELHLSLSPPDRKVRVFRSIVFSQSTWSVEVP